MRNADSRAENTSMAYRPDTRLWWLALSFLCLVVLGTAINIDPRLSSMFYDPTAPRRWFLGREMPWRGLYLYGEYPTFCAAFGAVVVWCGSWRRQTWVRYRRHCVLFVLAVALGPGVLVNGIIKPLWGRPRPQQTELFGGSQPYRHWWQPGKIGGGRSLPSGHASMGYVLVAGVCMLSPGRPRWLRSLILCGALAQGSALGLARIIQGGHFATDVLWSGCLMCALVALLHKFLPMPDAWPRWVQRDPGLASVPRPMS